MKFTKVKTTALRSRRLVEGDPDVPKSGCLYCPLLPWSRDFGKFTDVYARDSAKIREREPDGHVVNSRCVEQQWEPCDVLFIGEAPGADEDHKGEPFVGRSGQILRSQIRSCLPDASVGITNVVRCRPPRNRDPQRIEIAACGVELVREIRVRKPRVIVALGNVPLLWLTGRTGILTYSGQVLKCIQPEFSSIPVVGCLHPAYIARFDHEIGRFRAAIIVANKILDGTHETRAEHGTVTVCMTPEDVRSMLSSFRKGDKPVDAVAFDTETGGLSPFQTKFPQLLCLSFCQDEGKSFVVPYDHKESPWASSKLSARKQRAEVTKLLRSFFTDKHYRKIAHNEKFDRNHIRHALGVQPGLVVDTLLLHVLLDERRGSHGLDNLAVRYTGMSGYDKPLEDYKKQNNDCNPEKGGSYANIPGSILFSYAGHDADVTKRAYVAMLGDPEYIKNPQFRRISEQYFPRLSYWLADMEYTGACIDPTVVAELDKYYSDRMVQIRQSISTFATVRRFEAERLKRLVSEFVNRPRKKAMRRTVEEIEEGYRDAARFNPGSDDQLQKILYSKDFYGVTPIMLTDGGAERMRLRLAARIAEARAARPPRPDPTRSDIVKDALASGEYSYFSTNADTLQEIRHNTGNELVASILDYRGAETLHSTFIEPMRDRLDGSGLVHGSFLIHGTVTGRLSSKDPNLQNIANKGGGRIKDTYVSRFGSDGLLVQGDLSQIELRVAAGLFNEPAMIKIYREGGDIHLATALVISRLNKAQYEKLPKDEQKRLRTAAKRINFGILYGSAAPTLQATLKKEGIFVTIEECEEWIELYFDSRPRLRDGIDNLKAQVRRTGYVTSFTGRKRRVPEVASSDNWLVEAALRQAVNAPIQGIAAEYTLMAIPLIGEEMERRGLKSKMIITVHDSIIWDCVVDEFIEVSQIAKSIWENVKEHSDSILPGCDWSWLRTPIAADFDCGPTWNPNRMVGFDPEKPDIDLIWKKMTSAGMIGKSVIVRVRGEKPFRGQVTAMDDGKKEAKDAGNCIVQVGPDVFRSLAPELLQEL